jgi:hypothetical protein
MSFSYIQLKSTDSLLIYYNYFIDMLVRVTTFGNHYSYHANHSSVALASLAPQKFLCLAHYCNWLQEITKSEFGVASSGIVFIWKFIEISPAALELKHADRLTNMTIPFFFLFSHIVQRMQGNTVMFSFLLSVCCCHIKGQYCKRCIFMCISFWLKSIYCVSK